MLIRRVWLKIKGFGFFKELVSGIVLGVGINREIGEGALWRW
jgi:hypothetical protein